MNSKSVDEWTDVIRKNGNDLGAMAAAVIGELLRYDSDSGYDRDIDIETVANALRAVFHSGQEFWYWDNELPIQVENRRGK